MGKRLFFLKRNFFFLFWLFGGLLLLLAYTVPGFGTFWAEGPYRAVVSLVAPLIALLPFSVFEWGLYALLLLLLFFIPFGIVRLVRRREERLFRFWKGLLTPILLLGVLFFLYAAFCGVNYTRTSFAESSGLPVKERSTGELYSLCVSLAEDANALRDELPEGVDGTMQTHFSSQEERRWAAGEAFNTLEDEFPTLWSASIAPKSIFLSEGMCYLKITGIYMPLTLEANVNTAIRPDELAATMCHELSHLRGYMEEAEANFIAYLACLKSDDKEFQYAGTLLALIHAKNALYKADPDKNSEINALLSDGVKRDLTARNAFWQPYETPVAQMAESMNDGYLKLNQQSDGVNSYGRMVDLLLAWQEVQKKE